MPPSNLIVQHNYHNQAHVPPHEVELSHNNRVCFPLRLFEMLQLVEQEGLEHIVSWQPHGRCFVVHKQQQFEDILPRYFKQSKLSSFQRQLNLYQFTRITQGADKGGYYHESFLRGREWLLHRIERERVKGTGKRAKSNPEEEPDFYSMPYVKPFDTVSTMSPPAQVLLVNHDDDESVAAVNNLLTNSDGEDDKFGNLLRRSSIMSLNDEGKRRSSGILTRLASLGRLSSTGLCRVTSTSSAAPPSGDFEAEENDRLDQWGMSFHYVPREKTSSIPSHAKMVPI